MIGGIENSPARYKNENGSSQRESNKQVAISIPIRSNHVHRRNGWVDGVTLIGPDSLNQTIESIPGDYQFNAISNVKPTSVLA